MWQLRIVLPGATLPCQLWGLWCLLSSGWLWQWRRHPPPPTTRWETGRRAKSAKTETRQQGDATASNQSSFFSVFLYTTAERQQAEDCWRLTSDAADDTVRKRNWRLWDDALRWNLDSREMVSPFGHSVVGCGQDACFWVPDGSSGKLNKTTSQHNYYRRVNVSLLPHLSLFIHDRKTPNIN